jgi:hypothetical protein
MTFRKTAFRPARIIVSGMILLSLAACSRKSGEAVVFEKEHIAAAEIVSPTPTPTSAANDETETARDLKPGEIVLDGYLMDKDVRGTSKDPRSLTNEQWLVRVELISGGRRIDVHADRRQYEKVKPGDHVEVTYREGKYTGTIWSAEIK